VQPRRLTDSHRRGGNPHRGFELMKKGGACSGSLTLRRRRQHSRHSRCARILRREACRAGKNAPKTHNICG